MSAGEADDAYVFYSADPMRNNYVTLWSGLALKTIAPPIEAGKSSPTERNPGH
jgi:hypothetical protein